MIDQKMYSETGHAICAYVTVVCKNCTVQKMYSDDGHAKSAGDSLCTAQWGYRCTLIAHCACRKYCAFVLCTATSSDLISFDSEHANSAHSR